MFSNFSCNVMMLLALSKDSEHWRTIGAATRTALPIIQVVGPQYSRALRLGGVLVCYVPTYPIHMSGGIMRHLPWVGLGWVGVSRHVVAVHAVSYGTLH